MAIELPIWDLTRGAYTMIEVWILICYAQPDFRAYMAIEETEIIAIYSTKTEAESERDRLNSLPETIEAKCHYGIQRFAVI